MEEPLERPTATAAAEPVTPLELLLAIHKKLERLEKIVDRVAEHPIVRVWLKGAGLNGR